jgi:hypothetical protein
MGFLDCVKVPRSIGRERGVVNHAAAIFLAGDRRDLRFT